MSGSTTSSVNHSVSLRGSLRRVASLECATYQSGRWVAIARPDSIAGNARAGFYYSVDFRRPLSVRVSAGWVALCSGTQPPAGSSTALLSAPTGEVQQAELRRTLQGPCGDAQ